MQQNPALELRLIAFDTQDTKAGKFLVQMFGIDEHGKTTSIFVEGYEPFFYVKIGGNGLWTPSQKNCFSQRLQEDLENNAGITKLTLVQRKQLYGFDGGKLHMFVLITFKNESKMRNAKRLWYTKDVLQTYQGTTLYEAQIPPLLRLFHIKKISPTGWITLPAGSYTKQNKYAQLTSCDIEVTTSYQLIAPLPLKETIVPYKICSFDIEASSSHGDFPLPVKKYKKLAMNIADLCADMEADYINDDFLEVVVLTAFGFANYGNGNGAVDRVYPQIPVTDVAELKALFQKWIQILPGSALSGYNEPDFLDMDLVDDGDIDNDVEVEGSADYDDGSDQAVFWRNFKPKIKPYKRGNVLDMLADADVSRETKVLELTESLSSVFPTLQGDNVTFIGSTFLRFGEATPYLNHCIVRDTCAPVENTVIESYKTEREVLLAWTKLIQREDPDVVIGYNIFGFDYSFMFQRAQELHCEKAFLQLARNKAEVCWSKNWKTGKVGLEESSIILASGQHDLKYIKMTGRLQIDMYNYLRRDFQLPTYKLDYVSGYFIGDYVKKLAHLPTQETVVYTKNLTGLEPGTFIIFEEEAHSVDSYKHGQKFHVLAVDRALGTFTINGHEYPDLVNKKVKWGLMKDDVSPQDIFRLTKQGPAERAIIAKYCVQDCNLVQHLVRKIDVLTGLIEMGNLCSVPLEFVVLRGQGIKLTSYISKKCREKGVLMPVLNKGLVDDGGYEGATVLEPKCSLYLDDPVACLDYSSLYPSAMLSDNISHDSKVWTKEYNLAGQLVNCTGEQDARTGLFIYDKLPGYTYVDIEYNVYQMVKKTQSAAEEKVKVGYKVCRFAQFPTDPVTGLPGRAIMPAILQELLIARKTTRKLAEQHPDEFMRNILDKRQLSIKVTANSMYGQTGAKTSTFYEKDCAASTTAIGRKLLLYAKRVVEEAFGNQVLPTSHPKYPTVLSNAEYVYGDTDSVFFKFNLKTADASAEPIKGQDALELTIELAQQVGAVASQFLKYPHDLEYEKTFLPFCLLSKKRYVGMLYEMDPHKCKRKSMGIVLKRRDNAPIVKDIYGGIIDILMKAGDNSASKSLRNATDFLRSALKQMVAGQCDMDKLVITKALNSDYKNPKAIAHKVLADRMGKRDAGNKPSVGDRIAYVFIENSDRKALQGERIETPEYILAHKGSVKINYSYYITNQIMKPLQQVFALVLELMGEFKSIKGGCSLSVWKRQLATLRAAYPDEALYKRKEEALRNKEVKELLFDEFLRLADNLKTGSSDISTFFKQPRLN